MESVAFAFPVTPGRERDWRYWYREIRGARRSEYLAFRRRVGLVTDRVYYQSTPQGGLAIFYLEGEDLQRLEQELRTADDPFVVWLRQGAHDLLGGLDVTAAPWASLSALAFDGPCVAEDEEQGQATQQRSRLETMGP